MSYAVLTFNGMLVFDHVWQALYFVGCGFILAEVVSVSAPATAPLNRAEASRPLTTAEAAAATV